MSSTTNCAHARSVGFMLQPIVDLLVWMRVPGEAIFSIGALGLAVFVIGLRVSPTWTLT